MMALFRITPAVLSLSLPFLVLLMMLIASGLGIWLASLAIRNRDIRYAKPFAIQLLMYAVLVVYHASIIPEKYRLIYGLNPMAGVSEGFRAALLGSQSMLRDLLAVGSVVAISLPLGSPYSSKEWSIYSPMCLV